MLMDDDDFSPKMMDTKSYIRLNDDGEPQLVRVTPVMNDFGLVDKESVAVYVDDEEEPNIVPRVAVAVMLKVSGCVPLEEATNWKHKKVH